MTHEGSNRLLVAMAFLAAFSTASGAAPYRPTDDNLVLFESAAPTGQTKEFSTLRTKLAANPGDVDAALELARSAINEGRHKGDPRLYGQAQAALAPWWHAAAAPVDVIVLRATINQAFHAFPAALADLDHVLALDPGHLQARLSRSFIRMVIGNYQGAGEDCAAIQDRRAAIVRDICLARLGALTGKGQESSSALQVSLARTVSANETVHSFAQSVLAEISVGLGDVSTADTLFAQLTAGDSPDVATLAAYADLLLATGQADKALALLDNQGEADALLLRRAIAAKQLHDPRLAPWSAILQPQLPATTVCTCARKHGSGSTFLMTPKRLSCWPSKTGARRRNLRTLNCCWRQRWQQENHVRLHQCSSLSRQRGWMTQDSGPCCKGWRGSDGCCHECRNNPPRRR
jgi:tetratricopeptide (TPR) repeat protein